MERTGWPRRVLFRASQALRFIAPLALIVVVMAWFDVNFVVNEVGLGAILVSGAIVATDTIRGAVAIAKGRPTAGTKSTDQCRDP